MGCLVKGFRNVQDVSPSLCQVLFLALTPMTSSTPAGGDCCHPGRSRKGPPGPGHPLPCRRLLGPLPCSGHQRGGNKPGKAMSPARAGPQPPGRSALSPRPLAPAEGSSGDAAPTSPAAPQTHPPAGATAGPCWAPGRGRGCGTRGSGLGPGTEAAGRWWPRRFWTEPPQNPEPFSGSGAPPGGQSLHRVGRPPRTPRPRLLRSVPFHPLPHPTGGL